MLHEKRIRSLAIRIKSGCQGLRCPLEPAAARFCSVARRQFGSTSEGYAVFLCPQDLAGALSVCRRRSYWIPGSWDVRMVYTDDLSCRDLSQESNRAGQHQES